MATSLELDLGRPDDAVGRLLSLALDEDVGPGDWTTEAVVPAGARGQALMVAREPLVLSGLAAAARVFRLLDPSCALEPLHADGEALEAGEGALRIGGRLRALLTGERTALNLIQRLSGIATLTRRWVQALAGTRTRLLDTRKTTPGLRGLEKAAVRAGGGHNHRGALFDGILVKDNHAAAAGSIGLAVRRARAAGHPLLKVEAEVSTPAQIEEALAAGAEVLLLDNLGDAELAAAVKLVAGRVPTECSGGVTLERLPRIAACGVDYVSAGALTHSAQAVDLSLLIEASDAAGGERLSR
jgi:nicotinate-nucleotide pyrophosphorylase (carboxylating)